MRPSKTQREESLIRLREILKPGDTVTSVLRHVSRSGMSRSIDFYKLAPEGRLYLSGMIGNVLEYPYDRANGGIKVGGAGMDMGFHVVYSLARTLFPASFACTGERCPSNDHSNGDRDYKTLHLHSDGGYALRHEWL